MVQNAFEQLSWFHQERMSAARVMVVGCGALGNEVLKNLVLFGVEHLVVVDFDVVEMGNLSRSVLFRRADAEHHRRKVEVVAERLQELNPAVEVQTIFGDIAFDVGLGLLRQMDVVIGCVDSRWARYCINRLCMRAGIPWVDGGIDALEGTVRVFAPGKNCYACNLGAEGQQELARRMPCSGVIRRNEEAGRAPTTPIIASIIGAVEVQEAIKIIHEAQQPTIDSPFTSLCGKLFYYEGQHLTTKVAHFEAYDDDCPVHERWEPIRPTLITTDNTIAEALQILRTELQTDEVTIHLTNDCFVDFIEDRLRGERTEMMCAGHLIASKMDADEVLRTKPYSDFYQHEFHALDDTFPYPQLQLKAVGIPPRDVLYITTAKGDNYLEMIDQQ